MTTTPSPSVTDPAGQPSATAPARSPRRRVLVIVQGDLGDRPLGPEIRGWEMARAFAARHDVTIAATTRTSFVHHGLPVVPRHRRSLWREMRRHDVVVGPVLPPHLLGRLATRKVVRVSDQYDPVDLEHGTIAGNERVVGMQRALRRLQLRWSDIVISANERQRERAAKDLARDGRPGTMPVLLKVPMGLPAAPAHTDDHPLRDRLNIAAGDPVVLWWGTAWRWLDAEGAVRAVARLAERRPDVRLVITAGQPRNRGSDPLNRTDAAQDLAAELGVLDRNVFLFEDWVPYEERHRFLRDADIGITMHAATPESLLAARARYMDFLWAGLPSVLTKGDELAAEMGDAGASVLIGPGDTNEAANAIERLLDSPEAMRCAAEACREVAERYRWSPLMATLVSAVEHLQPAAPTPRERAAVLRETTAFYGRRLADTVVDAPAIVAEQRRRRVDRVSA